MTRALSIIAILTLITWGALESRAVAVPHDTSEALTLAVVSAQLDAEPTGGVIIDGTDSETIDMACSLCARSNDTDEMCAICRLHRR